MRAKCESSQNLKFFISFFKRSNEKKNMAQYFIWCLRKKTHLKAAFFRDNRTTILLYRSNIVGLVLKLNFDWNLGKFGALLMLKVEPNMPHFPWDSWCLKLTALGHHCVKKTGNVWQPERMIVGNKRNLLL